MANVYYLSEARKEEDEEAKEVEEKSGPVRSLPRSEFARIAREHQKALEDKAKIRLRDSCEIE